MTSKQIKGIGLGDSLANYQSTLIEELKSKLDKMDAKYAVYQSMFDKMLLMGGSDYTYLNVNKWILRNYGTWSTVAEYGNLYPVIGDYVYGLRTKDTTLDTGGGNANYDKSLIDGGGYLVLEKLADISTPEKLAKFAKRTTYREEYGHSYDATIDENYEPKNTELLVKCEYKGWTKSYTESRGANFYGIATLLLDFIYKRPFRWIFDYSTNNTITDRHISFEIVKYARDEDKYIRGLLYIPNTGYGAGTGLSNGISVLNNDVLIGEVKTDISYDNAKEVAPRKVFFINLNPLMVNVGYQFNT